MLLDRLQLLVKLPSAHAIWNTFSRRMHQAFHCKLLCANLPLHQSVSAAMKFMLTYARQIFALLKQLAFASASLACPHGSLCRVCRWNGHGREASGIVSWSAEEGGQHRQMQHHQLDLSSESPNRRVQGMLQCCSFIHRYFPLESVTSHSCFTSILSSLICNVSW